jgi:hypothetical protein
MGIIVVECQNYDTDGGRYVSSPCNQFQSTAVRKIQIDDYYVRVFMSNLSERLTFCCGLADDIEILVLQRRTQSFSHDLVIIDEKN